MRAHAPMDSGDDRLVPPTISCEPPTIMLAPQTFGSAHMATSGSPLSPAALLGTIPLCHHSEYSSALIPPPPAFQATSLFQVPSVLVSRSVPPTATTYGDDAGYEVITGPESGTPFVPSTGQEAPTSPVEENTV